jgi:hypothetical protein
MGTRGHAKHMHVLALQWAALQCFAAKDLRLCSNCSTDIHCWLFLTLIQVGRHPISWPSRVCTLVNTCAAAQDTRRGYYLIRCSCSSIDAGDKLHCWYLTNCSIAYVSFSMYNAISGLPVLFTPTKHSGGFTRC